MDRDRKFQISADPAVRFAPGRWRASAEELAAMPVCDLLDYWEGQGCDTYDASDVALIGDEIVRRFETLLAKEPTT